MDGVCVVSYGTKRARRAGGGIPDLREVGSPRGAIVEMTTGTALTHHEVMVGRSDEESPEPRFRVSRGELVPDRTREMMGTARTATASPIIAADDQHQAVRSVPAFRLEWGGS